MQRDEELLFPNGYNKHLFVAYGPSICELIGQGQPNDWPFPFS